MALTFQSNSHTSAAENRQVVLWILSRFNLISPQLHIGGTRRSNNTAFRFKTKFSSSTKLYEIHGELLF